jgi:hypothetical protein
LFSSDIIRARILRDALTDLENSFLHKAYNYTQDCGMRVASKGYLENLSASELSSRGWVRSNMRFPQLGCQVAKSYNPMSHASLAGPIGLAVAQ